MPECGHCGAHLTADYVRVNAPDGAETVRCCPHCPDRTRGLGVGSTDPGQIARNWQRGGAP